MILIISFISPFEINKVNPFPDLAAPFPLIFFFFFFFFKFLVLFEVKLLTNPVTVSLSKEIAMFVSAFFPKLPNRERKDPLD